MLKKRGFIVPSLSIQIIVRERAFCDSLFHLLGGHSRYLQHRWLTSKQKTDHQHCGAEILHGHIVPLHAFSDHSHTAMLGSNSQEDKTGA
jgi:hypothetical protein